MKKMVAGSLTTDMIQCEKSTSLNLVFQDWWKNGTGHLLSLLGSFHGSGKCLAEVQVFRVDMEQGETD